MTPNLRVLVFIGLVLLASTPGWAQSPPEHRGFWAEVQLGYGSLDVFSDQKPHDRRGTFTLALSLGGTLSRHVRIGGQLHGWLIEASDVWDPATGVSVSQALAIVEVCPWPARGLFLKAGFGRAYYTNHHPFEFGSSGWGATIGAGYDLFFARKFALTPVINYSRGGLGGVQNQVASITNREFGTFDFGIALTYR